jgi:DNA-binding beta-propeller fold protein YncE
MLLFPALAAVLALLAPELRFGRFVREIAGVREPEGVAVAADGSIVVAETGRDRIAIFAADGSPLRAWGERGGGRGQLIAPEGVAVSSDGEVFVADTGNDRVQVFTLAGEARREWGGRGAARDRLCEPVAIALSPDGSRVAVADRGNARVQVFDRAGKLLASVASGRGEPPLRPEGVALEDGDRIWVSDSDGDRVLVFGSGGGIVTTFGSTGALPGMLASPRGLALRSGRLFVADAHNHRVQAFASGYGVEYQWGLHVLQPHEGAGHLHYPNAVALDAKGSIAVVAEAFENRLQVFEAVPADTLPPLDEAALFGGEPLTHFGATLDAAGGLLAIPEPESHAIQLFDFTRSEPILVTAIGTRGRKFGEFVRPVAAALDPPRSMLYVADAGNRRLEQFRLDARPAGEMKFRPSMSRLVRSLDLAAVARDAGLEFAPDPCALTCDGAGDVFVVDRRNATVLVVSAKLELVRRFGDHESIPEPVAVALARSGGVAFVADAKRRRVQAFAASGAPAIAFGDDLVRPAGVAAGRDGFVYVTDAGSGRVLKFDEKGALVASFGREGLGAGEFFRPSGIAQDESGRLVVDDVGNHRGQIFDASGKFLDAFGSRAYVRAAKAPKERKQ